MPSMFVRARVGLVALCLALPGTSCGDDTKSETERPLPQAPQVMPTPLEGFLVFGLTSVGTPTVGHVLLTNQGRDALMVASADIEGRDAGLF